MISIVVPYGGGALPALERQIASLFHQRIESDLEVVVSANTQQALEEVNSIDLSDLSAVCLRIVDSSAAPGPSGARNLGWRSSLGDKVLFCDADDVVPSSWVRDLSEALDDSDITGSALLATAPPGGIQSPPLLISVPISKGSSVRFFPSCSIGFRRAALERLGGFDEHLRTCEDSDICYRGAIMGLRLSSSEGSPVTYFLRPSFGSVFLQNVAYGRGDILFLRKWRLPASTVFDTSFLFKLLRDILYWWRPENRRSLATRSGLLCGWVSTLCSVSLLSRRGCLVASCIRLDAG